MSTFSQFTDILLGKPLASHEEEGQRVGVLTGIPMLGLDALGSASYGPEAALTLLIPLGALGLAYIGPISGIIIAILLIVYVSYRQTITAYPKGGGSYSVARENLGKRLGLLAAAALLLDYILVVAVGISAGVGALVSAVPGLQPYTLALCLLILTGITIVNLRGTRESGLFFVIPTYLFVGCLSAVILIGVVKSLLSGGDPTPIVAPAPLPTAVAPVTLWLLMQAFASGCTAMTGVEAVSNGVPAFRDPATLHARRTLSVIVAILSVFLAGIAYLVQAYDIAATEPGQAGYQSILSQLVAAVVGRNWFYYVTIASILAVLAFSANTGFADFPRLCRVMAHDGFLPHSFAMRGRRLAFSQGIITLAVIAGALLVLFGGITDHLIPLFAVGAFLAFTLSQAGMVVHWQRVGGEHARRNMFINGLGAVATAVTLIVVLVAKFSHGAWITLVMLPLMLVTFLAIKRHYNNVAREVTSYEPVDVVDLRPPIVIVPLRGWSKMSRKAMRFALKLSPDVCGVQISVPEETPSIQAQWEKYVAAPTRAAGMQPPELVVIESPYRRLAGPLIEYVLKVVDDNPDRQVAVVISELMEARWYHYFLHQQRAETLRFRLLLSGDERIVIINIPWYLRR